MYKFGEKEFEEVWNVDAKKTEKVKVWKSPKYEESKAKAVQMIESGKYGLSEADFWILMNRTKSGTMAYTGLIISHNGCLKINDSLESELKFKSECVTTEISPFNESLVFTYCCKEQGLYEVGEVNKSNCKNDYPYAMALKRCFDRVVLKNSKLAYYGVYSDSEADEFAQKFDEPKPLDDTLVVELEELGGSLDIASEYFKVGKDELTNEHLIQLIESKKRNLAKGK